MKILLVDDEPTIQKLVRTMVEDAGYEFVCAEDGQKALGVALDQRPDLVIMDVMLPGLDGFAATRALRGVGVDVPVIFLSAKGDIEDKGSGFAAGGDDYLTKPFDPRELLMHIEAQLRRANAHGRTQPARDEAVEVGRMRIDPRSHRVTKDGIEIALTPKEFGIVQLLAEDPGAVISRDQLIETIWGKEFVGETTSITVLIRRLREKLEDDASDPKIIQTVWGVGYRLGS